MRAVQIFLVVIALVAVGVAGWSLGSRGGYGQPDTGHPSATGPHITQPAPNGEDSDGAAEELP